MADVEVQYMHGAVFPEDPGHVYLRADDVIDGIRRTLADLRAEIAKISDDDLLDQGECLKLAAMFGAVETLEQTADGLDVVALEFTLDLGASDGQ